MSCDDNRTRDPCTNNTTAPCFDMKAFSIFILIAWLFIPPCSGALFLKESADVQLWRQAIYEALMMPLLQTDKTAVLQQFGPCNIDRRVFSQEEDLHTESIPVLSKAPQAYSVCEYISAANPPIFIPSNEPLFRYAYDIRLNLLFYFDKNDRLIRVVDGIGFSFKL